MAEVGIQNSWSLMAFARTHGQLKIADLVNSKTGETFKSCAFVNGDSVCFVGFSSKLGELTAAQIVARKNELQVVLLESGNYKLCEMGNEAWESVNLGL